MTDTGGNSWAQVYLLTAAGASFLVELSELIIPRSPSDFRPVTEN
jgi:hypothetical protein